MTKITWIHPSYRDLVIDELIGDKELRTIFLKTIGIEGIQLALSTSVDTNGKRHFPLLIDDISWDVLIQRCKDIIPELNQYKLDLLLRIIYQSLKQIQDNNIKKLWDDQIKNICLGLVNKWDSHNAVIYTYLLKTYCDMTININPLPRIPNLDATWNYYKSGFNNCLIGEFQIEDTSDIISWIDLIWIIFNNEPRFLRRNNFPDQFINSFERLFDNLKATLEIEFDHLSINRLNEYLDRIPALAESIRDLSIITYQKSDLFEEISSFLYEKEEVIRQQKEKTSDHEPDDDEEVDYSENTDGFNLYELFSDL